MPPTSLLLCPDCRRHFLARESRCPFCHRALPYQLKVALALAAAASISCSGAKYGGSFAVGAAGVAAGAGGTVGGNGVAGGTTGGPTQYCGIPDGGVPVPCDELDGGNDGSGSTGGSGTTR